MMELSALVAPSGILAFVLFIAACASGLSRLRLFRYHAACGYACLAVTLSHGLFAVFGHVIEPIGVLAALAMVAAAASGLLRFRPRWHIGFSAAAFLFSIWHVAVVLANA